MSDTMSVSSNMSGDNAVGGILVEEVGQLDLLEFLPKKLVLLNYTVAALSEDGRLLLGEIRTRGGDDWTLAGRSVRDMSKFGIGGEERRFVDLALVPNVQHGQGGASLIFLVEKKNKERFITAHHIKHGKILSLEEEFSSYDKVNVLGKGVTHIVADVNAPEPTIYSASNLIRKLRLEDGGTTLKPTPARAQVPAEGQDGTLSMAIQPLNAGSKIQQSLVVVAFKTKSASKNKFMIEWYQSKKDELCCLKQAVKLAEDCEPNILLSDPKDTRTVYALCKNKAQGTTALYKITKGRKHEEPIANFNYEVELAALGMSADQNVTLMAYDMNNDVTRIYTLAKTEGFRGRHPICAHCPALEVIGSHSHILSCATHRWQLPLNLVDSLFSGPKFQMALVTLLEHSGRYVTEPETGNPYRLRVLGCDTQGFSSLAILLEDLERTFDNSEEKLAQATLKICLNQTPCRDSMSQLSAWLMAGRIGSVELTYVKGSSGVSESGSDRLSVKPISADRYRAYITDMDWTQMNQRQGTFTLDQNDSTPAAPSPNPMTTSTPAGIPLSGRTRIPVSRIPSATLSTSHHSSFNGSFHLDNGGGNESSMSSSKSGPESNDEIKSLVLHLSEALKSVVEDNESLRSNLGTLQESMKEIQRVVDH